MVSVGPVSLRGVRTGAVGPLRGATVECRSALTVLYGKNGSGKSSTLGAMLGSLAGRVDYPHAGVDVGVTHVLVQVPENSLFLASLLGVGPRPVTLQLLCTQVLGQWPQCPDPAIVEEMAADVVVAPFQSALVPAHGMCGCAHAAMPLGRATFDVGASPTGGKRGMSSESSFKPLETVMRRCGCEPGWLNSWVLQLTSSASSC